MIELPRTINAELLRSFVVVAETRHFTAASKRLNASQSAVSMQIQRLEESLQLKLLERTKREVRVTPEGEILLRYAHRVMRLTDEALMELGRRVTSGKVRVGSTDMTMAYLPNVLKRFYDLHPAIDIELRCGRSWDILDSLDAGEVDIAFVTQCCGRSGGELVMESPLVWACAKHSEVDEIDPVPLAVFGPGCVYRKEILKVLEAEGKPYRLAYESPSRAGLDSAVNAGLAVTTIPRNCLTENLRVIEPGDHDFPSLPTLKTFLFGVSQEKPTAVRAFADLLLETITEGPSA